jgi:GH25 family lysozyme M1 (1,4-beta-N-acetylmuramidase)
MSNKFIDISEHNTILSLKAIPTSGLCGVIMKATEGASYQDSIVDINYEALKGQIPIGFYHFLSATSEPKTQALNFWNQIKDKNFQIVSVLDVERNEKAPLEHLSEPYAKEFIQHFREISGQDVIIYSNRCYIEEYFSLEFRQNNQWWVADYSANETPEVVGCQIVAWQFTEDDRSYAFTIKDLDVNILVDESQFFIENKLPYIEDINDIDNSGKNILILQKELNKQGFRDKNNNKLVEDGISGDLTLSACPTLNMGSQGNITMWVQSNVLPVQVLWDGIFGEQTRQAVIIYQENMSLEGDGIVGKKTWSKLLGM